MSKVHRPLVNSKIISGNFSQCREFWYSVPNEKFEVKKRKQAACADYSYLKIQTQRWGKSIIDVGKIPLPGQHADTLVVVGVDVKQDLAFSFPEEWL